MLRTIKIAVFGGILVWAFVPAGVAQAANVVAPAPAPGQILGAKKVLISNMGIDVWSRAAFKKEQEVDKPYDQFYAAMTNWGRYRLVDNPDDADLGFEIRFTAPIASAGDATTYAPQLGLAIVGAKTHFRLWTLIEPVGGALRKATWDKNFSQGMTNLMDDLKKLTGAAPETANK
jgi:hypothetical protein